MAVVVQRFKSSGGKYFCLENITKCGWGLSQEPGCVPKLKNSLTSPQKLVTSCDSNIEAWPRKG